MTININDDCNKISADEIFSMMKETSDLVAQKEVSTLSGAAVAAQCSNALTDNVEFWKWMARNYSGSGIFDSVSSMQEYISRGTGNKEWLIKQLQGNKGITKQQLCL